MDEERSCRKWLRRISGPRLVAGLLRAAALFLGGFGLLNCVGEWLIPGFGANIWWTDLRLLPGWAAQSLLAAGSDSLVVCSIQPEAARRHAWVRAPIAILLAFVLWNAFTFWLLLLRGHISSPVLLPFSLFVAVTLGVVVVSPHRLRHPLTGSRRRELLFLPVAAAAAAFLFAIAQMCFFGKTDYRRPADAVVVFGAGVYADGTPSLALYDRMQTAIGLYRAGLAPKVVVSGGPGRGAVHETEAMRRLALAAGVASGDIVTDRQGLNTRATVANTVALAKRYGFGRVMAVSHFYHLPRIKMTYRRAGREVYTVPARESRILAALPYYMAREVAAFWSYYFRTGLAAA